MHYGHVGLQIGIANGLHEAERLLKTPLIQVVVKEPANTSGLITMGQEKVIVTPGFVLGIHTIAERLTRLLGGLVPVHGVFLRAVVGG